MSDGTVVSRENNVITRKEEASTNNRIFNEFNKVFVSGRIEEELEYSHKVGWEKFYRTRVVVTRLSEVEDFIPIIISNFLIGKKARNTTLKGKLVEVAGQFRSYNKFGKDGRGHSEIFLFVTEINICDNEDELEEKMNENLVYLEGDICKVPLVRSTYLGRQITELVIAVKKQVLADGRKYEKKDYIPCITWGRVAKLASEFEVGDRIQLYGRIQSRKYFKRYSPNSQDGEVKETYEVSVMQIQEVKDLKVER